MEVADSAPLTRDQLVDVLWAENCQSRKYFWPGIHNMEPYRSSPEVQRRTFPRADRVGKRVFTLPTGLTVGPPEIDAICEVIRIVLSHPGPVKDKLAAGKAL